MDERSNSSFSWREVKQEALAGLITLSSLGAIGGIAYIAYTVPQKLDHVIKNQEEFVQRITKLEDQYEAQQIRIVKLELRP